MIRSHRSISVLAALCAATLLTACGSSAAPAFSSDSTTSGSLSSDSTSSASPGPSTPSAGGTLTVFAAASLKKSFTTLGEIFQQENPGSTAAFSFAGSADLVAQIIAGAPADVFASADAANMTKATAGRVVSGEPVDFATNTLTIVTPPGNPAGITTFADLAGPDVTIVVCAPQVPCGAATQKIEDATGISLTPASEESSVTDVLNKVRTGEADAGLVYVTDASAAGDKVSTVAFPESTTVVNTYPIATLAGSTQPELAAKFVELVTGPQGQQVLAAAGFAPPP